MSNLINHCRKGLAGKAQPGTELAEIPGATAAEHVLNSKKLIAKHSLKDEDRVEAEKEKKKIVRRMAKDNTLRLKAMLKEKESKSGGGGEEGGGRAIIEKDEEDCQGEEVGEGGCSGMAAAPNGDGDTDVDDDGDYENEGARERASKATGLLDAQLWEFDAEAESFFNDSIVCARKDDEAIERAEKQRKIEAAKLEAVKPKRAKATRTSAGPRKSKEGKEGKSSVSNDKVKKERRKREKKEIEDMGDQTETEGEDEEGETDSDDDAPLTAMVRKPRSSSGKARGASGVPKVRQEATSLVLDKAMRSNADAKKVRVSKAAKESLKGLAKTFLIDLLACPEVKSNVKESSVKAAVRAWVPAGQGLDGLGNKVRGSLKCPPELKVSTCAIKRQIKAIHSGYVDGDLKKLPTAGVERVQAIVGFFCECLVEQAIGIAVFQGVKVITNEWLDSAGSDPHTHVHTSSVEQLSAPFGSAQTHSKWIDQWSW